MRRYECPPTGRTEREEGVSGGMSDRRGGGHSQAVTAEPVYRCHSRFLSLQPKKGSTSQVHTRSNSGGGTDDRGFTLSHNVHVHSIFH